MRPSASMLALMLIGAWVAFPIDMQSALLLRNELPVFDTMIWVWHIIVISTLVEAL